MTLPLKTDAFRIKFINQIQKQVWVLKLCLGLVLKVNWRYYANDSKWSYDVVPFRSSFWLSQKLWNRKHNFDRSYMTRFGPYMIHILYWAKNTAWPMRWIKNVLLRIKNEIYSQNNATAVYSKETQTCFWIWLMILIRKASA